MQAQADRDPLKSQEYLLKACKANHAPSCFNLAVMYKNGDIGIPPNEEKFLQYKEITQKLAHQLGGLKGRRKA